MNGGNVTWSNREPPLTPCAVAAQKDVARQLARRLLEFDPAALHRLAGVAGKTTLVLLGNETDLPWANGVIYLGQDPAAPSLLLPTWLEPIVPDAHLLERALHKRFPQSIRPLAVLPDSHTIIPCENAVPLSSSRLEAWLAEGNT